jgi:hypothetical protein
MIDSKQRLFEIMGRLDPTFKVKPALNENKKTGKKKLNEYDNYNYPAGADADPNAPWNERPEPEWNGKINIDPSDNIEDFIITIYSTSPSEEAYNEVNLYTLVQKYAQGQDQYFLDAIQQPNPEQNPELMKKINDMLEQYADGDVEWEAYENDDEPPERDDLW